MEEQTKMKRLKDFKDLFKFWGNFSNKTNNNRVTVYLVSGLTMGSISTVISRKIRLLLEELSETIILHDKVCYTVRELYIKENRTIIITKSKINKIK